MDPAAVTRTHLSESSWVVHCQGWLPDADSAIEALAIELEWRQEYLNMFGKSLAQPRLTAVCGVSMDPASRYRRSNPVTPWAPAAGYVRDRVEGVVAGWRPNGLIANRYRDGQDSIGWHSDSEPALGHHPVVVSVSLGESRVLLLRPREGGPRRAFELAHGDLFVMGGATQKEFVHSISKVGRPVGERISLTFRKYLVDDAGPR
ncbi:alpha-ketoglutarate-dependent dioxygenase AlkB [Pedococcus sp. KACC 23699]|uniref:Alpha-ketoglutarate-dependent dioxygenase AlkB n=1 Tax=Pedococcus sp. KACC 23699 TaxID=3149228 RepID=A0AAU7JY22_9MICO